MALSDVLVTGATVLHSSTGAALPNINTVPFNSYGSWSSWTSLGVTTAPTRARYDREYYAFESQQAPSPLFYRVVGRRAAVRFEIAELTGAALALLLDGALTTTNPSAGVKGVSTIELNAGFSTTERQWAFEGFRPDSSGTLQPVRWFFYLGVLMIDGDFDFNRRDATKARCTLMCAPVNGSLGRIQIVTAPATS